VYVGQTTQSIEARWGQHISDRRRKNHHLHNAINAHGKDAFDAVVLHQAFDRPELNQMEIAAIWRHESNKREFGYNDSAGGEGGTPSAETRAKMSLAKTAKKQSAEHVRKRAIAQTGEKNWAFGKTFSHEYREKLSAAKRGKPAPEGSLRALVEHHCDRRGSKFSEQSKAKLSASLKAMWAKKKQEAARA
jgi:group I intron endonuclease